MEIIQLVISLGIAAGLVLSYRGYLELVKPLLFAQAIAMQLSNFNVYRKSADVADGRETYTNYEGLNMLTTLFSVVFTIYNSIMMGFCYRNSTIKNVLVGILYSLQTIILMATNFDFSDISVHSSISILIAVVYTLILVPTFSVLIKSILNETINEQKLAFQKQDGFRKMFDSI